MPRQDQFAPRVCGGWRRTIEHDPTLVFQTDWVLCPTCAEELLPPKPTSPAARH